MGHEDAVYNFALNEYTVLGICFANIYLPVNYSNYHKMTVSLVMLIVISSASCKNYLQEWTQNQYESSCDANMLYRHKIKPTVFTILSATEQANLHLCTTIVTGVGFFGYGIDSAADLHC